MEEIYDAGTIFSYPSKLLLNIEEITSFNNEVDDPNNNRSY